MLGHAGQGTRRSLGNDSPTALLRSAEMCIRIITSARFEVMLPNELLPDPCLVSLPTSKRFSGPSSGGITRFLPSTVGTCKALRLSS